jgi:hypothetical protein
LPPMVEAHSITVQPGEPFRSASFGQAIVSG